MQAGQGMQCVILLLLHCSNLGFKVMATQAPAFSQLGQIEKITVFLETSIPRLTAILQQI
jgi:hypothetical protein